MSFSETNPRHLLIGGPTASGKSELALRVAESIGAEIVSVDACQIYRGLDVGTGKLPVEERHGIPHHLIDICDPWEAFSVADFVQHAREVIRSTDGPLVWAGGTGFYFSALIEGLSPVPESPPEIRNEVAQLSEEERRAEVEAVDPEWAAGADLNNPRRVSRALEVFRATGIPLSQWQKKREPGPLDGLPLFYLCPEPETLRSRIDQRVADMLERGWPEEVTALAEEEGWESSQSFQAIGYAEVLRLIRREMDKEACLEEIRKQTWHYARRQRTWFKKMPDCRPLGNKPEEEIRRKIGV